MSAVLLYDVITNFILVWCLVRIGFVLLGFDLLCYFHAAAGA